MKTIFRFFGLAVLIAGFTAAGGTSIFAQDTPATPTPDPCEATAAVRAPIEEKIRTNYATKDLKLRKEVNDAGDGYLTTYVNDPCESVKGFVTYLNGYLPGSKKWVKDTETAVIRKVLLDRLNPAVKGSNWDETYASGKELIALEPDSPNALNAILVLGSIGLDETLKTPRVTKYNDDTLKYARMAIDKLNSGKTSGNFGVGGFNYLVLKPGTKDGDPVASKENALGWMNYTIGAVTYYGLNNKKDALPYLYKATQINSQTKTKPQVYGILGDYYFDEVVRLGEEIKTKTIAANAANLKETPELNALIALQKGYTERAIDAYARAQNAVPVADAATDPKKKAYRDGIGKRIEDLYKVRFDNTDGVAVFVKTQLSKPLPDPSVTPTPIVEVEPAPVTPGTTTPAPTTGTKPAAPGTKPVTTPASTNGTKPAVTSPATTKKPVSVNGTTGGTTIAGAKPAVKKPVVKKKGTR